MKNTVPQNKNKLQALKPAVYFCTRDGLLPVFSGGKAGENAALLRKGILVKSIAVIIPFKAVP
ncbi:MAG: hypothetical protein IJH99_09130 [Eubacterium sp.]|nr:hypothetical protein [Eubacterium sp.]